MTFPTSDMPLTHILVVTNIERSRRWYADLLGAELHREYGGDSAVLSFNGSWLLLVTGGEPTDDKPTVRLAPPIDPERLDHLFTIRVPDCRSAYEILRSRGAQFPDAADRPRSGDPLLLPGSGRPSLRDQ